MLDLFRGEEDALLSHRPDQVAILGLFRRTLSGGHCRPDLLAARGVVGQKHEPDVCLPFSMIVNPLASGVCERTLAQRAVLLARQQSLSIVLPMP